MSKTKQRLWTKFGDKEFFARMAENAKNDADGNEITQTYATKDVATTSADGLMSSADKNKLNGLETGAEVNAIESISANGTALSPDASKNVDIPLATSESAGLIPSAEFGRIPGIPNPQDGEDQVFSYDSDNSAGWQPITKGYVGNVLLDEQTGEPVLDEEGETPIYDEESAELWTAYKGTEFGARRAYEDHTGANIHESLKSKVDKVTGAAGKLPAFNAGGNLVDSGVPLESLQPADGGTDLSLVTTGEKFNWNTVRSVPASTSADEGKLLTVNSAGSPEWKAPRIPVVASTAQDDTISGTVLTSVVHPYTYKEITVDDTVTKLVIQLEDAVSGVLQEAAFQFTLGNSSVLDAFEVHRGAYVLPAIGADTFTTGKTYQGTVVNGLVTLAEFDAPSYI